MSWAVGLIVIFFLFWVVALGIHVWSFWTEPEHVGDVLNMRTVPLSEAAYLFQNALNRDSNYRMIFTKFPASRFDLKSKHHFVWKLRNGKIQQEDMNTPTDETPNNTSVLDRAQSMKTLLAGGFEYVSLALPYSSADVTYKLTDGDERQAAPNNEHGATCKDATDGKSVSLGKQVICNVRKCLSADPTVDYVQIVAHATALNNFAQTRTASLPLYQLAYNKSNNSYGVTRDRNTQIQPPAGKTWNLDTFAEYIDAQNLVGMEKMKQITILTANSANRSGTPCTRISIADRRTEKQM